MDKTVDSYKFIRGITQRMVKTWIKMEVPREIPWTPLAKPLFLHPLPESTLFT